MHVLAFVILNLNFDMIRYPYSCIKCINKYTYMHLKQNKTVLLKFLEQNTKISDEKIHEKEMFIVTVRSLIEKKNHN